MYICSNVKITTTNTVTKRLFCALTLLFFPRHISSPHVPLGLLSPLDLPAHYDLPRPPSDRHLLSLDDHPCNVEKLADELLNQRIQATLSTCMSLMSEKETFAIYLNPPPRPPSPPPL